MKSNILNRHQKNSFCLNTKSFLLFFLFAHLFAFSQIEEVKNYEWEAVPKFNEIPKEFEIILQ